MRRVVCGALLMLAAAWFLLGAVSEDAVFIRIDRDDPLAWERALDNVRFLPEEGMSGSAQFSAGQFHALAQELRQKSDEVWIIDCRLESHGFINAVAVSWCDENNGANLGKSVEEIESEEAAFDALVGTSVSAFTTENDQPIDETQYAVETWQTERELVRAEGFHYLRLACPDHCWPPADVIEEFIAFAAQLGEDSWLHFHCQAGSGRTGTFMTIYEMMLTPDAPVEEILRHQAETGSGNLLDRAKPEKSHAQKERCVLARAVYLYIRENRDSGYALKWGDWLCAHTRTITMQVGDELEGSCFSSDPFVVTDAFEALSLGQATVLAGDTVYFITVR